MAVTATLSEDGDDWSLKVGKAVWRSLITGDNQPAMALQRESQGDKDSDLILPSPVYSLASPVAKARWELVNVDHPGHRVERVEGGSGGANGSYLAH